MYKIKKIKNWLTEYDDTLASKEYLKYCSENEKRNDQEDTNKEKKVPWYRFSDTQVVKDNIYFLFNKKNEEEKNNVSKDIQEDIQEYGYKSDYTEYLINALISENTEELMDNYEKYSNNLSNKTSNKTK